jgi:hypothetical protein
VIPPGDHSLLRRPGCESEVGQLTQTDHPVLRGPEARDYRVERDLHPLHGVARRPAPANLLQQLAQR